MKDTLNYIFESGVSIQEVIIYAKRCKITVPEAISRLYFKVLYRNLYVDFGGEG